MKKNVLRIFEIAKRMGVSNHVIIEILLSAGYVIPKNNPNIFLNSDQILVISKAYTQSVKSFYKSSSANYKDLSLERRFELAHFFSRFIDNSEDLSTDEVFNANLEDELVANFFKYIIYSRRYYSAKYHLDRILRKIKLRIPRIEIDKRAEILSIVLTNSNHIYPKEEEEHNRLAQESVSFSVVIELLREAKINLLSYLKLILWKTYNY